jgi:hypothetical protein
MIIVRKLLPGTMVDNMDGRVGVSFDRLTLLELGADQRNWELQISKQQSIRYIR